jgi:transposase-like protein
MCHVYFLRAILRNLPKKAYGEVILLIKNVLKGNEEDLGRIAIELEKMGFSKAAGPIEQFMFDLGNYRAFPKSHWERLQTTNMMERVNAEIKRRSKAVSAFPSENSIIHLIVSILMDINEE